MLDQFWIWINSGFDLFGKTLVMVCSFIRRHDFRLFLILVAINAQCLDQLGLQNDATLPFCFHL